MLKKLIIICLGLLMVSCLMIQSPLSATLDPSQAKQEMIDKVHHNDSPKALFREPRYFFGKVAEGETIHHDFVVENLGNAPLVIKNIRPD